MAIRIRKIGDYTIALCAVESDAKEGDIYLDDGIHHALTTKFSEDMNIGVSDPILVELMQKEKVRDAEKELLKRLKNS